MPTRTPSAKRWRSWASGSAGRRKSSRPGARNLGHEQVLTTFSSYGEVAHHRQAELIRGLDRPAHGDAPTAAAIEKALRTLQNAIQRPH